MKHLAAITFGILLALGGACSDDETSNPPVGSGGATSTTSQGGTGAVGGSGATGGGGSGSGSEICDNDVDDDGDDAVDCADRDCALDAGCPPWCEAAAAARCYYVDAVHGDDANDGSFETPFRTYLNLVSYYGTPGEQGSTAPPDTAVALEPGDAIYFFDGTYGETYNYQGDTKAFYVRGRNGDETHGYRLEGYPGQHPVFAPSGQAVAMQIDQSGYWSVRAIEIDSAWGRGLLVSESDHVEIESVHIHDTDGVDNDNISGLYLLSSTYVTASGMEIHDNYDREAADTGGQATENSSNVVVFGGGFIEIRASHVYNTLGIADDKIGGCIKYKHMRSVDGGTFAVLQNRLENCRFYSVGTGSPDSTIEHNLVIDSAPFVLHNFGGPTALTNIRMRFNTMVNTAAVSIDPDDEGDWVPLADIEYSDNVAVDDSPSYNSDQAMVRIGPYDSNEQYAVATAPGVLTFTDNCYFNAETELAFDLFSAENFGDLGGFYDLVAWQALGYDVGSLDEDPAFDAQYRATSAGCAARGHLAAR